MSTSSCRTTCTRLSPSSVAANDLCHPSSSSSNLALLSHFKRPIEIPNVVSGSEAFTMTLSTATITLPRFASISEITRATGKLTNTGGAHKHRADPCRQLATQMPRQEGAEQSALKPLAIFDAALIARRSALARWLIEKYTRPHTARADRRALAGEVVTECVFRFAHSVRPLLTATWGVNATASDTGRSRIIYR